MYELSDVCFKPAGPQKRSMCRFNQSRSLHGLVTNLDIYDVRQLGLTIYNNNRVGPYFMCYAEYQRKESSDRKAYMEAEALLVVHNSCFCGLLILPETQGIGHGMGKKNLGKPTSMIYLMSAVRRCFRKLHFRPKYRCHDHHISQVGSYFIYDISLSLGSCALNKPELLVIASV